MLTARLPPAAAPARHGIHGYAQPVGYLPGCQARRGDLEFDRIGRLYLPDTLVDLLIRFLSQNEGKLSKRGREKEFEKLTEKEIQAIEAKYAEVFSLAE